jgi:hypothetical protein
VGPLSLITLGFVLSIVLSLTQKWLWMRQLDYVGIFWTLLSVKWGIFGLALFVSILYLWINLRFAARNVDVLQGTSFFSKELPHLLSVRDSSIAMPSCCGESLGKTPSPLERRQSRAC